MKKAFLTATILAFSGSAIADVTNPVNEAKAKDWMQAQYPVVQVALACQLENRFEYLETVMQTAYLAAGTGNDQMQKDIVNMWWGELAITMRGNQLVKLAQATKQYPDHPDIVKGCKTLSNTITKTLHTINQAKSG